MTNPTFAISGALVVFQKALMSGEWSSLSTQANVIKSSDHRDVTKRFAWNNSLHRNSCRCSSFYAEYFHFKVKEYTRNGTPKRKDLCSSVVFFENQQKAIFEPTTITKKHDTTRTDRLLIKRLRGIINNSEDYHIDVKESCAKIIEYISYNSRNNGISPEEIDAIWARINELHDLEPWYLTMER